MGLVPDPTSHIADILKIVQSPRVQQVRKGYKPITPIVNKTFQQAQQKFNSPGLQFGKNIGGFLAGLGQQQQQDPITALYEQLLGQLSSPVAMPTAPNNADIMNQVKAAINPIYDQRANTARAQGDRAQADVQGMYGQLADDYERLAPQQAAQAKQAQDEISQVYGQLRSNIEGNYSRVSNDQAELFKSLGIEDALPDAMAGQSDVVNDALTAASENQAQQQQRYMDLGQADQTYYREGSPIATMAGNEYSRGILDQLTDYLNQNESERASGIQSSYLDQLGQATNNYNQQLQFAQSQQQNNQQMLFQMLQAQMQAQAQQSNQPVTADSFLSGLPNGVQQSTAGAYTQLERSPEAVYGKVEDPRNPVPGTFVETTPQWYMAQADKMYQSGQIDGPTYQALLQYLQLKYKS